ncbi:hypothetical protein [Paludibaculum fermentans]|uniref:Uncharacterized protein n=1 Tax=Paludibaculum fermentans TaxID=1473598 RepID=A0A7S7NSU0_PALFE|nr:hypothetical protein [Paludibaculum fermentans]QOY89193.1 hypothetical protein IRI77_04325 [Paludibaculum fermentans]
MRWFLFLVALASASAQRKPEPGCQWVQWESEDLGLRMSVQKCEGRAAREFKVLNNKIRMVNPGQEAAMGNAVIEVWEKPPRQSVQEAINRRFYPKMTSRQQMGCVVTDAGEKFPLGDPNKQVFQITPNALYKSEADKIRESEPGAEVCGLYGELDQKQYFEYHPTESKIRYLFIRLGLDTPMFDERSIELAAK